MSLDAGTGTNYYWSTGVTTREIQVNGQGIYFVTYTDVQGRSIEKSFEVQVQNPEISLGGDKILCAGSVLTLSVPSYATIDWATPSGPLTGNKVTFNEPGSYSIQVTTTNGCTFSDAIFVSLIDNPNVSLGEDITVCQGEDVKLTAPSDGTYEWKASSGGVVTNSTAKTINVTESGTYQLSVTNNAGCTNTEEIKVTFLEKPTGSINQPEKACPGQVVELQATKGQSNTDNQANTEPQILSYLWSTGQTTEQIEVTQPGSYSLQITNQYGCSSISQIEVEFKDVEVVLENLYEVCKDDPLQYPIEELPKNAKVFWTYPSGTETVEGTNIILKEEGRYLVKVQAEECEASKFIEVKHYAAPPLPEDETVSFCDGQEELIVNAGAEATFYRWSTGATTRTITVTEPGVYLVRASNNEKCWVSRFITVESPLADLEDVTFNLCPAEFPFRLEVPDNLPQFAGTDWIGVLKSLEFPNYITVYDPGIYELEVTYKGCQKVINYFVNNFEVIVRPGSSLSMCRNEEKQLMVNVSSDVSYLEWYLDDELIDEGEKTEITICKPGNYKVIAYREKDSDCFKELALPVTIDANLCPFSEYDNIAEIVTALQDDFDYKDPEFEEAKKELKASVTANAMNNKGWVAGHYTNPINGKRRIYVLKTLPNGFLHNIEIIKEESQALFADGAFPEFFSTLSVRDISDGGSLAINGRIPSGNVQAGFYLEYSSQEGKYNTSLKAASATVANSYVSAISDFGTAASSYLSDNVPFVALNYAYDIAFSSSEAYSLQENYRRGFVKVWGARADPIAFPHGARYNRESEVNDLSNLGRAVGFSYGYDGTFIERVVPMYRYFDASYGGWKIERLLNNESGQGWAINDNNEAAGWIYTIDPGGSTTKIRGFYQNLDCSNPDGTAQFQLIREESIVSVRGLNDNSLVTGAYITSIDIPDNPDTEEDETLNIPSTNRAYVYKGCGCNDGGEFYDATEDIVRQAYPELPWILRNSLAINNQNYIMGMAQLTPDSPLFPYRLYVPPCVTCQKQLETKFWSVRVPFPINDEALNGLDVVKITVSFPQGADKVYTGQDLKDLLASNELVFEQLGEHNIEIEIKCITSNVIITRKVRTYTGIIPRPIKSTIQKYARTPEPYEGHIFEERETDYFLLGNQRVGKDLLIIQDFLPYASYFADSDNKAYKHFEDQGYEFADKPFFADIIVREIERYNKANPTQKITYDIITDHKELVKEDFAQTMYDYSAIWINMEGMNESGIYAYKKNFEAFEEYAKRRTLVVTAGKYAYGYQEQMARITSNAGNNVRWGLPLDISMDQRLGAGYESKELVPGAYEEGSPYTSILESNFESYNVFEELKELYEDKGFTGSGMSFDVIAKRSLENVLDRNVAGGTIDQFYASTALSFSRTYTSNILSLSSLTEPEVLFNLDNTDFTPAEVGDGRDKGVTIYTENFQSITLPYDDGRIIAFSQGLLWAAANGYLASDEATTVSQKTLKNLIANIKDYNLNNFITYPIAEMPLHFKDVQAFSVNNPELDVNSIQWYLQRVNDPEEKWTKIDNPEEFYFENEDNWDRVQFKAVNGQYEHIVEMPVAKWGVWVTNKSGRKFIYRKGNDEKNQDLHIDKQSGKVLVIVHGAELFGVSYHVNTIAMQNQEYQTDVNNPMVKDWLDNGYTVIELDWAQMSDHINIFSVENNIWETHAAVPWRKTLKGTNGTPDLANIGWRSDHISVQGNVASYLAQEFKDFYGEVFVENNVPVTEFRVLAHGVGAQLGAKLLDDWLVSTTYGIDELRDNCVSKQLDLADYITTTNVGDKMSNNLKSLAENYDVPITHYRTTYIDEVADYAVAWFCYRTTGGVDAKSCVIGSIINLFLAGTGALVNTSAKAATTLYLFANRVNNFETLRGQVRNLGKLVGDLFARQYFSEVFIYAPVPNLLTEPVSLSTHNYAYAYYLSNINNQAGVVYPVRPQAEFSDAVSLLELYDKSNPIDLPAIGPSSCAELLRRYRGYNLIAIERPTDYYNASQYKFGVARKYNILDVIDNYTGLVPSFISDLDYTFIALNEKNLIEAWNGLDCNNDKYKSTSMLTYYINNPEWYNRDPQRIIVNDDFKDEKLTYYYGFQPPGERLQWVEMKCQNQTDCPESFRFEPTLINLNGKEFYKPPVGTMWLRVEYNCGQEILFDQVPVEVFDFGLYKKENTNTGRLNVVTPVIPAPFQYVTNQSPTFDEQDIIIFVGGWNKGITATGQRDILEREETDMLSSLVDKSTVAIWQYSMLADTETPGILQSKIREEVPEKGLEWIDQKGNKQYYNTTKNLTDLLVEDLQLVYEKLNQAGTASGPTVRLVGHGVGAQLVIDAAHKLNKDNIRLALLDPVWFNQDRYQELLSKVEEMVADKRLLLEWYQSSQFDIEGYTGDEPIGQNPSMLNKDMKALGAVVQIDPKWVNEKLWPSTGRAFAPVTFTTYAAQDYMVNQSSTHAASIDYFFKGYIGPDDPKKDTHYPVIYFKDFNVMEQGGYESISAKLKETTLKPVEMNAQPFTVSEFFFEKLGAGLNAGTCNRDLFRLTGVQLVQSLQYTLKSPTSGEEDMEVQLLKWVLYAPDETADKVTEAQEN